MAICSTSLFYLLPPNIPEAGFGFKVDKLEKQTAKKKKKHDEILSRQVQGIISFMSTNWDQLARKCWRKGSGDYSGR